MKKSGLIGLFFMVVLATWGIEACNNGPLAGTEDSLDAAKEANDSSLAIAVGDVDAQFMVSIADKAVEEVELARLAQQKSTNPVIKEFAVRMEKSFSEMSGELRTLSASKNITLPRMMGEKAQVTITEQTQKKGTEFDTGVMHKIISAHEHLVSLLEKEEKDGGDVDIRLFAGKMLPAVQGYLTEAKEIADKIK